MWYMTWVFLHQGKLVDKVTQKESREGEAEQDPRFWMMVNVVTHKHLVAHTAAEPFDLMERDKVCMVHLAPLSLVVLCNIPLFKS